jgi:hypothetical protein
MKTGITGIKNLEYAERKPDPPRYVKEKAIKIFISIGMSCQNLQEGKSVKTKNNNRINEGMRTRYVLIVWSR